MRLSAIILALALVWTLTPQAVARRCIGEFSAPASLVPCACTVYNRLHAKPVGWNPAKVLSAYHAGDGAASPAQVDAVERVLSGETVCRSDLYFMYGKGDKAAAHLDGYTPALVVRDGEREVWFFGRWFRKAPPGGVTARGG